VPIFTKAQFYYRVYSFLLPETTFEPVVTFNVLSFHNVFKHFRLISFKFPPLQGTVNQYPLVPSCCRTSQLGTVALHLSEAYFYLQCSSA